MKRPFGGGITPGIGGLTKHTCELATKWDDPPSTGRTLHKSTSQVKYDILDGKSQIFRASDVKLRRSRITLRES